MMSSDSTQMSPPCSMVPRRSAGKHLVQLRTTGMRLIPEATPSARDSCTSPGSPTASSTANVELAIAYAADAPMLTASLK